VSEYPHVYPDSIAHDPRIITVGCGKCERQWLVLIPEKKPRRFLEDLRCRCGSDMDDFIIVAGRDKLRMILHGVVR